MYKLRELAELVGGTLKGNPELTITGFCSLDNPSPTAISFMEKGKDAGKLSNIMLGALVTTDALAQYFPDVIIHDNPKLAFISIMDRFISLKPKLVEGGFVHERAVVDPTAKIAATAVVQANAVISAGVQIGERSYIGAGVYVGRNCRIGDDSVIHANVSIYRECQIGNHVEIHAGTVVGADGFGYVPTREGHRRFPQEGSVVIEDNVEIGANCCIDRASLDQTVIHAGSKLDNLVQIAHGVVVGANTVIFI